MLLCRLLLLTIRIQYELLLLYLQELSNLYHCCRLQATTEEWCRVTWWFTGDRSLGLWTKYRLTANWQRASAKGWLVQTLLSPPISQLVSIPLHQYLRRKACFVTASEGYSQLEFSLLVISRQPDRKKKQILHFAYIRKSWNCQWIGAISKRI